MSGEAAEGQRQSAFERERERLERENARLREELAFLSDGFDGPGQSPVELAGEYEQEAVDGDPEERAQNLVEAASYWVMAGEVERARRRYREAIADGGSVSGDARVWYALFLLEHGDEEEGRNLLDVVLAERPGDFVVYETAGEGLEEHGEWAAALRWFDAGLVRLRMSGSGREFQDDLGRVRLGSGRARVRRLLGLPEDETDRGVDRDRAQWAEKLQQLARPSRPRPASVTALYFPEAEFMQALQRWPGFSDLCSSFEEHRRNVERSLRDLDPGRPRLVVIATAAGLAEYATESGGDPERPDTRGSFAAHLAENGHAVAWPPGRNDSCWCGSTRKYKKCCGRPS
jgi:tetratricopeptide (TPR) repeat protein